ncbi:hypothetical protein D3C85_1301750 [compost metagenome]
MQRQLDVDPYDVVLQFELGLTRFGNAHVRHVHGALGGIAFATPEIKGIAETQRRVIVPGGAVGQLAGAIELVGRPVVTLEGGFAIDLQRLGRFSHAGHGPGLTHPGGGHGQGRAALQSEIDPAIQLRVAIGLPPLRGGPVRLLRGALDCLVGGQ